MKETHAKFVILPLNEENGNNLNYLFYKDSSLLLRMIDNGKIEFYISRK